VTDNKSFDRIATALVSEIVRGRDSGQVPATGLEWEIDPGQDSGRLIGPAQDNDHLIDRAPDNGPTQVNVLQPGRDLPPDLAEAAITLSAMSVRAG
jgi:hypothetical protein